MSNRAETKRELQAAGLWATYLELRDRYRAEGLSAEAARQRAYQAAKTTPLLPAPDVVVPAPAPGAVPVPELLPSRRSRGLPVNWKRDVEWAYQNLEAPPGTETRPPSLGAVGLLKWARGNRDSFFGNFVKQLAVGRAVASRSGPIDEGQGEPGTRLLDRVLAEAIAAAKTEKAGEGD